MVKKAKIESIEEITKKEISVVDASDKLLKLEKSAARDKKIIAEYKDREKASARALVLFERKLKYLKTTMIDDLLKLSSVIDNLKNQFENRCSEIYNSDLKSDLLTYKDNYTLFANEIYNICNKIELNATISREDRAFISNKKVESDSPVDINSRFNRLKEQFNQKIGASVMRRPGRPKKEDQSVVADIGLGKKVEKKIKENDEAIDKLNELFYSAPSRKSVVSNIPQTSDSVFDFNEALNPNVSLKDIMADLMTEKDDDVKTYSKDSTANIIQSEEQKSKIELLESGFIRTPAIKKQPTIVHNKTVDKVQNKPTFEKRFLSIQNITKI